MKKRLKGFTLIELIVVIATFTIIMFGAMSLMQPVRKIFIKTYKQESMSAAAGSISTYLEDALRYAECIQITDTAPSDADLISFVDGHYRGKVYQIDDAGTMQYANGDLYVLRVDNAAGGEITQWRYYYTAGDDCCIGLPLDPSDPSTRYLYYNGVADYRLATDDDIPSTISLVSTTPNAINKAMYADYHFNISLGIYELNSGLLVQDADYYTSFVSDPTLQGFGQRNFGLTVTAYEHNPVKSLDRVDNGDGTYSYTPGFTFSTSLALSNVKGGKYSTYSWQYDAATDTSKLETFLDAGGTEHTKFLQPIPAAPAFACTVANQCEPDVFYIIYTYPGDDIIR